MEVVRSNFLSILPLVEDIIKRSVFIAIDTEFTGLAFKPEDEPSLFDSLQVRYSKVRRTVRQFVICQFGLSGFIKASDKNRYVAHSFNFYLFPRECFQHSPRFLIQSSNMDFLCQHNFDFNKWVYEGISYCNQSEEALLTRQTDAIKKDEWTNTIGFRQVFQLLVKYKKPLLGHNMLLDLAYMIDKFHGPLPASYEEFKTTVHSLFPTIIDTKNVCHALRKRLDHSNLLDNSNLGELYEKLGSRQGTFQVLCAPEIQHSDESSKYSNENCFHEAGFDSYCVGFVFLRLAHLLAMNGVNSSEARPVHIQQYLRLVGPYVNKVNLLRGPVNFIDFANKDHPQKERGWLIVQSANGEDLCIKTVKRHMNEFCCVDVQLIQSDCALVAVATKHRVPHILEGMAQHPLLHVRRYSWFKDSLLVQPFRNVVIPAAGSLLLLASLYYLWTFYFY